MIGSGFHSLLRHYYGIGEIDELFAASDGSDGGAAGANAAPGARMQRELSFEQFVRAARAIGALSDAETLRLELLRNRDVRDADAAGRRHRHSERFDAMLATFADWTVGGEEGRLLAEVGNERLRAVLGGCFAGARNRQVVSALKILYEDHAPLRMGGDLIFGLMTRVVHGAQRARKAA